VENRIVQGICNQSGIRDHATNSLHPQHKQEAISCAKTVLETPEQYVILDTETTGLDASDEVLQIGVIDPQGGHESPQGF
jgi:hypothetical protein